MGPSGSVLTREMDVGFRDLRRQHETVMLVASRFSELLEPFPPEQFSQCVGRIHGAVDHNMHDVDSFRRELCVKCLAEHAASSHGGRMRMLSAVAAHRRG